MKSLKYSEFKKSPRAWSLEEFALGQVNLIVGKNASGKTRTLNIIGNVANLVSGQFLERGRRLPYKTGDHEFYFDKNGEIIKYCLGINNSKIYREELIIDQKNLLRRGIGGKGEIFYVKEDKEITFQIPDNELAVVARRDSVQHPFLENLFQWGKNTLHYRFGSDLGKSTLALFNKVKEEEDLNLKATEGVVGFLKKGLSKYGKKFESKILKEMKLIGYEIKRIGVELLIDVTVKGGGEIHPEGIYVEEADLNHRTYQHNISEGMFRALSLIIQLNFAEFESLPSCILIDDIGEGLDFERSSKLIKLLINKANKTSVQLIMATNDRFVMNNVPLENWSIITRDRSKCKILNYQNSREVFDEFEFTGLNNFDFFSSNFFSKN